MTARIRIQVRVAQAASLSFPAACRKHSAYERRPTERSTHCVRPRVAASCRDRQAGSLRYPEVSRRAGTAVLLLFLALGGAVRADQPLAPATIVVFNRNLPESSELAKFYAQKRGIARDHLVGLDCSKDEEINREDYDRTIAGPLRDILKQRRWWTMGAGAAGAPAVIASSVHFIALMKGMPLKIRPAENYPGDKKGDGAVSGRNEASVDSELALLARFDLSVFGAVNNPYFKSYRRIMESADLPLLLVCRLDAPSAETVRRMITDAIEAEKNGLWGRAYVDRAHNTSPGYEVGDEWLGEVVRQLHKVGIPVVEENTPALFPEGYPMSDCALYYGWYTGDVSGPFRQADFRFTPGAIAVHIHSFSANTLRNPNANWVGPLLTKGAAASIGNVYEPYLQLTSHLDILNDRLLHGFTFAESAYMSMQGLSWMSVMVGDPLYRPYGSWLEIDLKRDVAGAASNWKTYHDFALQHAALPAPEYRTQARQAASRANNGVMIEDLGLMEAKDGNHAAAVTYFQQARTVYTRREDILRVVLEEADSWVKQSKPKRAVELIRSVLRIVSEGPTADLLKKVEQDVNAAAPGATPKR